MTQVTTEAAKMQTDWLPAPQISQEARNHYAAMVRSRLRQRRKMRQTRDLEKFFGNPRIAETIQTGIDQLTRNAKGIIAAAPRKVVAQ